MFFAIDSYEISMGHIVAFAIHRCNFGHPALHLWVVGKLTALDCATTVPLECGQSNDGFNHGVGISLGLADVVSFKAVLPDKGIPLSGFQICFDHFVDELIEACAWAPTELAPCFG